MLNILKKLVETKIGRTVNTRGDCQLISDAILESLDVEISYSTIKRVYGLNASTKPNTRTLNILANFVGYDNYSHFIQTYNFEISNNLNFQIYKVISKMDHEKIIKLINASKKNTQNFSDFIIVLIRELLHNKNFKLINKIFQLEALKYSTFSYSEILYVGNSIGLLLKTSNKIDNSLLSNVNFIEFIFSTFVDYSSLNKYYGKAAKFVLANHNSKEIKLFANALLEFKNFLNKKKICLVKLDLIYSNKLHPILCGRLFSLYFLKDKNFNNELVITKYFKIHSKKTHIVDYSYELFIAAILTRNRFLMSKLISKIEVEFNNLFLYQKFHVNIYYLMCLFFYRLESNKSKENRFRQLFSIDGCTIGYMDFIRSLHLIYLHDSESLTIKKQLIRYEYMKITKNLNYPYLNIDFINNYFIK